jgi:hypothetical protein
MLRASATAGGDGWNGSGQPGCNLASSDSAGPRSSAGKPSLCRLEGPSANAISRQFTAAVNSDFGATTCLGGRRSGGRRPDRARVGRLSTLGTQRTRRAERSRATALPAGPGPKRRRAKRRQPDGDRTSRSGRPGRAEARRPARPALPPAPGGLPSAAPAIRANRLPGTPISRSWRNWRAPRSAIRSRPCGKPTSAERCSRPPCRQSSGRR